MRAFLLTACGLAASLGSAARGANVYLLSSGDPATDSAAVAALTSRGHTVTAGVTYESFDGSVDLAGFQTVYLQCNANWQGLLMPDAGQQQLITWVNGGGRLVTSEWVSYYSYANGKFGILGSILPAAQTFSYSTFLTATYTAGTPDSVVNAGLPSSFSFALFSYTGTETFAVAKSGATTYYTTNNGPNPAAAAGLVGWGVGSGSVFSFLSTCGPDQVADTNFGRLFSNVMGASAQVPCYANCDQSTVAPILNANDFQCFVNQYAAENAAANCDGSTVPPTLNVNDFQCFVNAFAVGCP